jgi:hypothetical protein
MQQKRKRELQPAVDEILTEETTVEETESHLFAQQDEVVDHEVEMTEIEDHEETLDETIEQQVDHISQLPDLSLQIQPNESLSDNLDPKVIL